MSELNEWETHGYFCHCSGNRATQSAGLKRRTEEVQKEREGSQEGGVFMLCDYGPHRNEDRGLIRKAKAKGQLSMGMTRPHSSHPTISAHASIRGHGTPYLAHMIVNVSWKQSGALPL
ncbi:hypothetical protein VNO78_03721 [Psophocarpus tetragonolobus]|uniref:Uncharacterized protein n=1 Tax=Psophocarpus tetragonolobus TaxID=3891 RepID=A0AAN9T3L1_PSOTE